MEEYLMDLFLSIPTLPYRFNNNNWYKKKHSPSLGDPKTRIKRFLLHLKKKKRKCAHMCNVNTAGIIFLWDFRVSMSMRAEQLFVHWWGDEVMWQQCTAHFLHSQSRDDVVTSIRSLQVESGVTCNPCVPHESVCKRRLSRGLLLVGSAEIS